MLWDNRCFTLVIDWKPFAIVEIYIHASRSNDTKQQHKNQMRNNSDN